MNFYVYVIRDGFIKNGQWSGGHWAKIGITHNVERRLATLQTGNPLPLRCVAKFPIASRAEALSMEAELHEVLSDHRGRGGSEWFKWKNVKRVMTLKIADTGKKKRNVTTPLMRIMMEEGGFQ